MEIMRPAICGQYPANSMISTLLLVQKMVVKFSNFFKQKEIISKMLNKLFYLHVKNFSSFSAANFPRKKEINGQSTRTRNAENYPIPSRYTRSIANVGVPLDAPFSHLLASAHACGKWPTGKKSRIDQDWLRTEEISPGMRYLQRR